MNSITLRFPQPPATDITLGNGTHALSRQAQAMVLTRVGMAAEVSISIDKLGIWMRVHPGMRSVHVNGRPVRRIAMLRVGDSVFVDGADFVLVATAREAVEEPSAAVTQAAHEDLHVVLRGVGGRYHGKCITLNQPRVVGRGSGADILIDEAEFPLQHACIEQVGGQIHLRDLESPRATVLNGELVRDAVLRPGDQLLFDLRHRFVVEAPLRNRPAVPLPSAPASEVVDHDVRRGRRDLSFLRLPLVLLAAILLAGVLVALLLFGVG